MASPDIVRQLGVAARRRPRMRYGPPGVRASQLGAGVRRGQAAVTTDQTTIRMACSRSGAPPDRSTSQRGWLLVGGSFTTACPSRPVLANRLSDSAGHAGRVHWSDLRLLALRRIPGRREDHDGGRPRSPAAEPAWPAPAQSAPPGVVLPRQLRPGPPAHPRDLRAVGDDHGHLGGVAGLFVQIATIWVTLQASQARRRLRRSPAGSWSPRPPLGS